MKTLSFIKYLFLTVGLALLSGAIYLYLNKQTFLDNAVSVQGKVVKLLPTSTDNSITYKTVVLFNTKDGEQIEYISSFSTNPPSYDIGENVEILYNSNDPKDATINAFAFLWLGPLILGIIGIVFFLIGFLIILFNNLKQKKIKALQDNGKRILTKFDGVAINSGTAVNGRNPFQICSRWLDTNTNELYLFKSEDIWFDPTDFVGSEPIKVMIDPNDPKKYYMDISFLPKVKN